MKAGRGLTVLFCTWAIFLPGADLAFAQEEEKKPVIESKVEEKDKQPETESEQGKVEEQKPLVEKVTVTATRVETELMKTPIAVSVFDQDELDREGVQNVRDMAQMVPNMDIATDNGQSTPVISLRGVRSTNTTELGDSAVGVHLDGVYSPRMQGILALMFDNERVEVLRGPQGTLFGRNSTVGSINIVPAKPKIGTYDSSFVTRNGNWNSREVAGMLNVPVSDKFAFRVAGRAFKRDSYLKGFWDPNQYDQRRIAHLVQNADVIAPGSLDGSGENQCTSPRCYTRTQKENWWTNFASEDGYPVRELIPADPEDFYMNADEWAYRVSGLWLPAKDLSVDFSWQRFRTDSAGGIDLVNCDKMRGRPNYEAVFDEDPDSPTFEDQIGIVEFGTDDCGDIFPTDDTYQAVVSTPGRLFLNIDYLRSRVTWDIKDDLRFVYLGGFEDMDRESAQDMEQSLNAWDQAFYFLPGTGSKSWSSEVQLQSYSDKSFNWIAGINFFRERTSTLGYFDNTIRDKDLFFQPNRGTDAAAVFAQGTYSYSPKWHLTLGYRFSDETKRDKGGRSYNCTTANDNDPAAICAPEIPRDDGIIPSDSGFRAFDREALNNLPLDYFANPDVYGTSQNNTNRGSWSHNDFRIGLDYDKSENTLLYSYLATGFKAGGIGDVVDTLNDRTLENIRIETSFDQEEVTTLELGFKTRLLDRKLDLRGAYFYSDYEDMQYASVGALGITEKKVFLRDPQGNFIIDPETGLIEFAFVPTPIVAFITDNVPGAQIQGFEFEYDWRAWPGGRIKGYASWLDAKITEDWYNIWAYDPRSYLNIADFDDSIDPENELLQVNLKGNELAVSPPLKFHVTVDHAFLMPGARTTLVPWVTAHWEAASYLTVWNVDKHTDDLNFALFDQDIRYTDDKREAWSMVHAGLRIYHGDWTVEFYGYNLTDEVVQWWGGAAERVTKGSFSMPMNYGFHVGIKF